MPTCSWRLLWDSWGPAPALWSLRSGLRTAERLNQGEKCWGFFPSEADVGNAAESLSSFPGGSEVIENSANNPEETSSHLLGPVQKFLSIWGGARGKESRDSVLLRPCSHFLENSSVFPGPEKWQGGRLGFHAWLRFPDFKEPESRNEGVCVRASSKTWQNLVL